MSTLLRTTLVLGSAALISCVEPKPKSYHWTAIAADEDSGLVLGLTLAPDGTPYAQARNGVYRFDGAVFVRASPEFPSASAPILFATDGTIYCAGSRLRPGATAWEALAGGDALGDHTPTPTTSGDLYALMAGRVVYQASGSTSWTPLLPEGITFEQLVPDAAGGVFALSQRSLYQASGGVLRYLRAEVGIQDITADGLEYSANGNYTSDYGEVIERSLDGHEVVRTDGLTCVQSGDEVCPFNEQYPHAAFITSFQRTRSGTYFEMWAPFNSVDSPRTLLRLSPGAHQWEAIKGTQNPDGSGIDGLAVPVIDAKDRVWVWSNSQFAVVANGGYVSSLTSALYRLDPD